MRPIPRPWPTIRPGPSARVTSPKVAATTERIDTEAALLQAVAAYLQERGLQETIALRPHATLLSLDGSDFE